jgi:hypothetical protein
MLSSSPEQGIKWRRGATPAFTGEVALSVVPSYFTRFPQICKYRPD